MVLYLGIRFFISGSTKSRILLLGAGSIGSSLLLMLPIFAPVAERLRNLSSDVSLQIRLGYIYALLYSILDTWGAGLGIGQYGLFWKDIYVAYIDYAVFDKYGEVAANLAGSSYMKPWSVVLGVGVDFGIIGLLVFLLFLYLVWKACLTPHDKAIFVTSFILIMGAYPIVTPHIWLVFAFIVAKGYSQHIVMHAAYQPKNSL